MQSPSSLIFLVLLGVWAAYFVQYWVRRRDHVATARSVEQFSEAMRVLERRDPLPRTDLSEQAPRSYAVHPARANRPQVMVKRAVAAKPVGPVMLTARVERNEDAVHTPASAPARPAASGATATGATATGATASGATEPGATAARPVRPRLRPSRRVRGLLVLASLVELLVIVPLVALSMLPAWALGSAVITVVAAVAFLRSGVRAEQAMMRAHRRRQADLARLRSTAPVTKPGRRVTSRTVPARPASAGATASGATASGSAAPASTASDPAGAESSPLTGARPLTAGETGATADRSPLDVALEVAPATPAPGPVVESSVVPAEPVPAPAAGVMVPIVDDDDMPLTWDPVPVPRPTYTMKAKAERPEVAPAAVTPEAAPVEREDAADSDYAQRRVAGA